jgi:diguanylate cyclase (GGDEF)-like protein
MGDTPSSANLPDADILAIRTDFVAKMWKGLLLVAVISWPITLWRIYSIGWTSLFGFHLGLATLMGTAALVQHRFAFGVRAALLLAMLWLVGVPGLFSFGLMAPGTLWLVLSCLVAGTVYSVRAGTLVAAATGLLLLAAAVGFVSGRLHTAVDADLYLSQPSSWASLIVVTGIFSVLVLQSFSAFMRATETLLLRVKQQRDEIEHLSLHDSLTGLPLAGLANDRIQMAMHAARRANKRMAVLFVDLDGFKRVNSSLGYDAGDALLKITAERMVACLRGEDTVARIGGDEFLVVVSAVSEPMQAARVAEKLVRAAGQPIEFKGRQVQVGASIGIAIYPDDAEDVQNLRRMADLAMYEAKRQGSNRHHFAREPADDSSSQ